MGRVVVRVKGVATRGTGDRKAFLSAEFLEKIDFPVMGSIWVCEFFRSGSFTFLMTVGWSGRAGSYVSVM